MITEFTSFLYMGGYGGYIFSAYGLVIAYLIVQWALPWRRSNNYSRAQKMKAHE